MKIPLALTIAGSDPSAGAGIQADLKTFSALGVYAYTVITAITAQNPARVLSIQALDPEIVAAQIRSACEYCAPQAIKLGMLHNGDTVQAVVDTLRNYPTVPMVFDPVLASSSGAELGSKDFAGQLADQLLPRVDLITPNWHEAARLLGTSTADSEDQAIGHARELLEAGARAVLLTGGDQRNADTVVDIFISQAGKKIWRSPRIVTTNTHGTGCTLAAAITAYLAKSYALVDAIGQARRYSWQALAQADKIATGNLNHFYHLTPPELT